MKNIINTKELKKKRGKMKSLSLSLLLLFSTILINVSIASAVNDFDQYKPYLHNPSVGNVPKLETFGEYKTDLYPGAGTYTYNIVVPRGILGLQPSISLFYNSQSVLQRPGVLGAGWSLSENSISRNINYSVNDTTDDYFILSFNNNRLKVFYNGSSWNTEINPRQYRVQNLSNGAKMYWLITTTDGTEYRFGFNNDSKMDSNTGRNYAVKWNLDLIEDVNENKIFYNYKQNPFAEDKGAIYLSNITYNNDEKKLILFSYETQARPDRRLIYDQGNILDESRRLNEISILFDGSLVRRYSLGYETLSDIQSLSSLANITYFGADNSSVLNTISFEYYNTTQGFDNTTNKWVVPGGFVFSSSSSSGQDFGVRLLDVNNDGFPDLIKAKSGETHETRLNNKQDGWNASSILVIPSGIEIADGSGVDQGVRFEDVNSDGLIDILQAKEGSTKKAYINNGTGWNDATNWTIPTNFIGSSSEGLGVELTDINGDGKVDIIRSQEPNIKEIYTNNGSGWKNVTSDWNIPDFFSTSSNKDTGLRILDINNDGLPDLIKGGIPGNAWFNNGSGWTQHSEYAPNLEFVDNSGSRPDLGVRFIELNGDGLVDIVQNFLSNVSIINQTCVDQGNSTEECITGQNITFATNAKLNNGTGWMSASGWLSPEKFTDEGLNIGRRIADVNGDGYPDIVVAYQGPPSENITHIKNATNAFLLKTVVGAYGGETEIHYTQSTLSDNGNNLGFNIWIVKNTSLNNSVGNGFEAESGYSYLYFNGKFDYLNKEFRGFGIVNETLPDSSTVSHFFHQDNALKGREFKTSIYGSQGNHIRDNLNSYSISGDNMIYLNETSSQIYDGEATPFVTNVTFEYDLYGNIQKVNNLGNVDISGDEKFETFNYFYNTTNFVVNKPSNYTLFASDDSTIVNQINYFYDGQTGGVNIGRLTKVKNINNLGGNPETLYAYDSLGNVITLTNPRGYNTTYGYESTGSFKTNETNALGHIVQYNYNLGTGNLLSEVRDGLNKTFEYDIFGRLTKEIISPDNFGSPTTIYTYNLDGTAPESIKVEKKNNDSDYSEDIFIYDGFGKVIQTRNLFIPTTTQIVNNYFYDSSYRIIRIQNPYFESYSSDLTSPASGLTTNYTYDSLGRVTNITKQDGSTIGVIFDQDLVTQFDENGNRIDYNLDAYNRITNVQEYNGTDVYDTTYSYRVDNVLTNITDAKNNNFIFGYDSLGRRISLDDPNMNEWTYNYDLNGNLINQTDGRNITVSMTYDSLNRLTLKFSNNSNVSFVYDIQYNGTLTNITLDGSHFNIVYHQYTYDDRLRVNQENIFICYREVDPGDDECEWINYTIKYDSSDKITNMTFPHYNVSYSISYDYNSIGKIKKINDFLNSTNYNAFGSISNKTYANNLITKIDYNELNRLTLLQTSTLQNLSYSYDNIGNIQLINDTKNSRATTMEYDDLNRLTIARIYNYLTKEHEKFFYLYDSIGNLLSMTNDIVQVNFTFGSRAHAPVNISRFDRQSARIELNTTYPTSDISVNKNSFFNYTTNVCCKDNDCWGVDVYLDPQDKGFTPFSETYCIGIICNKILYSGVRFVFEDNRWKKIENAKSLTSVWSVDIQEDPDFPVQIIDYNYTAITLNLSNKQFRLLAIPLSVYNRYNKTEKPKGGEGNVKDKDRSIRVGRNDWEIVTIDLSDTIENLLTQEIKWGDASTIVTVYDNTSTNLGDSYVRSGTSYQNLNFGNESWLNVRNFSTSNMHAIIKFNLSHLPREAIVENARLYLYLDDNNLGVGESYNVSSYYTFSHYNWTEGGIKWINRPNSTDYNNTFTDQVKISGGAGGTSLGYLTWNVTSIVKYKGNNESFYLYVHYNDGGDSTDEIQFSSKQNPAITERPYLNITYLLKGVVSTNSSETPFYTNISNPYYLNLEQNQCQTITWWVNATGDIREYIFFAYANKTANQSIGNKSSYVNITII